MNYDNKAATIVAYNIILFISSFFIPFIIIYPIQEVVYVPESYWFFHTPQNAYFFMIAGLLSISIAIFIFVFLRSRLEEYRKNVLRSLLGVSFIPGILVLFLSLNYYYYFNDNGIFKNDFLAINEKTFLWSEVKEAKKTIVTESGTTKPVDYKFTYKDGETIIFEFTRKITYNRAKIEYMLAKNGIEVKKIFIEIPEEKKG